MAITIDGSGTITGINAGGLPDGSVTADDLATDAVTTAKIEDSAVTTTKITDANITAAKLDGAQSGSAPIYGARAWVNFDGTRNEADTGPSTNGANVKIRASGNVSSVTKNGTGDYTVNFTTALSDANYAFTGSSGESAGSEVWEGTGRTASTFRLLVYATETGTNKDSTAVSVIVFR